MRLIDWLLVVWSIFLLATLYKLVVIWFQANTAHRFDLKWSRHEARSRPDVLPTILALLSVVLSVFKQTEVCHAEENSEQSKVDGKEGGSEGS